MDHIGPAGGAVDAEQAEDGSVDVLNVVVPVHDHHTQRHGVEHARARRGAAHLQRLLRCTPHLRRWGRATTASPTRLGQDERNISRPGGTRLAAVDLELGVRRGEDGLEWAGCLGLAQHKIAAIP